MDTTANNSLRAHFPVLIVSPDERERTELLCKLFCRNVFCQDRPKHILYISKFNMHRELVDTFRYGNWEVDFNGVIDKEYIRSINDQLAGEHCYLIIDDMAGEVSSDPELMKLVIDDCIDQYNMTPILLTGTLFHRTPQGANRKIALHCGYVFLFGDDPTLSHSSAGDMKEFAADLYSEAENAACARSELLHAFMELCWFNKTERCPETYRSYVFIDRTREDNMIKVYQKRHFEHRTRPPYIHQLPDVRDPKRGGWAADWWYRTCPLDDPYGGSTFYRRPRGIPLPPDLNTDTQWHAAVINAYTDEQVHKLASYIRGLESMKPSQREEVLEAIMADVVSEYARLKDEVFYVENNEMHSHCLT